MSAKMMSTVAAGAAIISAGTLVSRLLGLVRENLLVNTFLPNHMIVDAYNSAFMVPDLVYYLLAGGALSAAFIPVFSGYLAKGQREDAQRTFSSIANLMMLAIVIGMALVAIFAPQVVRVVANGYEPGSPKFNITVMLAREMCVMLIFTALSGLLTGVLQSVHHFLTPVVVWNTYNLGIIFGISVLSKLHVPAWVPEFFHWNGPTLGIHGAAMGVVLGATTLALIQLPVVYKHGFRLTPVIDLAHEGVRKVLALFAPVMLGLSLSQVNLLAIPLIMGSLLPDGAVTDLRNANRLILLPLGLFAVAISTAAFPALAQQFALGEKQAFRETVGKAIKVIVLLAIPSAVGMLVLAEPIVALLYGGKNFGLTDIQATAFALSFFTWGLLAVSLVQFINRAFYSLHDTITPVFVSVGMIAANVGLSLLLIYYSPLNYGGVALSSSLTITASTVLLFELLRRRMGGIGGRDILRTIGKIALAAGLMGGVMYLAATLLAPTATVAEHLVKITPNLPFRWPAPDLEHPVKVGIMAVNGHALRISLALQMAVAMGAGMLVYAIALWVLKVEELRIVTDRFMAKVRRKSPTAV